MKKILCSVRLISFLLFLFVSFGTNSVFADPVLPPEVVTSAATEITSSTATLNGEVFPNRQVTNVIFRWGTSNDYTHSGPDNPIQISDPTAVSLPISDLNSDTVYHFRVEAAHIESISVFGENMTFFTGTPSPPTAATNAASSITSSGVTLNGTVNSGGGSATVTFEYGLTTSYGSAAIATQSPVANTSNEAVTAVLDELVGGATYHYRVKAESAQGTSYGSDMTFTTDPSAPTAITVVPSSVSNNSAILNGLVNANGQPASVLFRYGTTNDYSESTPAIPSPVTGTTLTPVARTISGLTENTIYHFMVEAFYTAGTYAIATGQDMTFFTGTPSPPTATTISVDPITVTSSGATLRGAVNSGGGPAAVTFQYGPTTSYGSIVSAQPNPVTSTSNEAVSADLHDLTSGTTYHYRARAVSTQGTGYGNDMTFKTSFSPPVVTTDPAASVSNTSAILNGTVNSLGSNTTTTFEYGLSTSYGTTVTADQSPISGFGYTPVTSTLTGLLTGTSYHYRVVGVNDGGTTHGSDMTFTTSVNGPLAITMEASEIRQTSALLNGIINANDSPTAVTFQYDTSTSFNPNRAIPATPGVVTGNSNTPVSLHISNLTPGETYYFRITAKHGDGTTSSGNAYSFTTKDIFPWFLFPKGMTAQE